MSDDAPVASPLGRSTAAMAAGTLLSRLTGFGRVFALAYALGFNGLSDAYNLANTTPNLIYDLVLGGVLSATLIPVIVDELSREDEGDAWRSVSAVLTITMVVLGVVTVAMVAAAPLVIDLYTLGNHQRSAGDQRVAATRLLQLFAPQVLLLGGIFLTQAVLNARRRFANPAFTPVANNVVTIAVLLAFPHLFPTGLTAVGHDPAALAFLGLGTTAGYLVQLALQLPPLRGAGVRLRPVWDPRASAVRAVLRLSAWTVGVVALNQAALLVILVLANRRSGDVSSYQAAYLFFLLPHSIVAVSIMTTLLPDLAGLWSRRRPLEVAAGLEGGLRSTLALMVPAAVGYTLLAGPLVSLVLEHGRLGGAKAAVTASTLAWFSVGLPGFSAFLLCTRGWQALRDTRTMFWLYLLENAINVVAALALYPLLGVRGLAFSWGLAYTLAAAPAWVLLRRRCGAPVLPVGLRRTLVAVGAAAALMGVAVALVARLLRDVPGPAQLLRVTVAVAAGGAVYLGAARVLRIEETLALLRIGRRPR